MENAGVRKKQSAESPSVARTFWDPFWLMREMFGWGGVHDEPAFAVEERDDAYVCKVKVRLTLPDRADVAHVKAELDDGQLTLTVPKAAEAAAAEPGPLAPSRGARGPKGNARRAAARTRRRGGRTPPRRG